jgi:hypothetical protein
LDNTLIVQQETSLNPDESYSSCSFPFNQNISGAPMSNIRFSFVETIYG